MNTKKNCRIQWMPFFLHISAHCACCQRPSYSHSISIRVALWRTRIWPVVSKQPPRFVLADTRCSLSIYLLCGTYELSCHNPNGAKWSHVHTSLRRSRMSDKLIRYNVICFLFHMRFFRLHLFLFCRQPFCCCSCSCGIFALFDATDFRTFFFVFCFCRRSRATHNHRNKNNVCSIGWKLWRLLHNQKCIIFFLRFSFSALVFISDSCRAGTIYISIWTFISSVSSDNNQVCIAQICDMIVVHVIPLPGIKSKD